MLEPDDIPTKRLLDLLEKLGREIKQSRAAWNAEIASALDARRQTYAVTRTEDGEDYDFYFYDRKGEPIPASCPRLPPRHTPPFSKGTHDPTWRAGFNGHVGARNMEVLR